MIYYGGLDNLFLWITAAPMLIAIVGWILYEVAKGITRLFPEVRK